MIYRFWKGLFLLLQNVYANTDNIDNFVLTWKTRVVSAYFNG